MFDGVDDEVAQDAFHTAGVCLGDDGLQVAADAYGRALAFGEGAAPLTTRRTTSRRSMGSASRAAAAGVEAADLQQVGEQGFEAVELVGEEFRRAGGDRVEVLAGLVDDVGGHPYGRQGCAQFVRHVGHEPPLHP